MSATCPQCSASDCTVAVPQALAPGAQPPLDEPSRARLAPPPAPQQAPYRMGGTAISFFVLAGVFTLGSVVSLITESGADEGYDAAYQLGRDMGRFLVPVLFLCVALASHTVARRRHLRDAARPNPMQQTLWQRRHQVWQAAWFCHRCHVAFFPAAVLRPDFPASPPIPLDQFPLWVVTATDRVHGFPPSPAASG
ncbi:hypothetical protein ACFVVL_21440 [Kitasatospora sp. NPDC058115]|uniref:hypothetical protein n=1 Tax=Kitasatospora sp. NPDC058115 TaxID=3346347 RepID=UPI0036DDEEC2